MKRTRTAALILGLVASCLLSVAATAEAAPASRARVHPHRKPWPVVLTVRTVPALPGIRFAVDGLTVTTDGNGTARFTQEHNFDAHALTLVDTTVDRPNERYRFVRWSGQRDPDQAFRPNITGLPMRANSTVTAAFSTQYAVAVHVADGLHGHIAASRVSALTVRGSAGQEVPVPASGRVWLDSQLPVYEHSRFSIRNVTYTLHTLRIDGADVAEAGSQRFDPAQTRDVALTVPLFTLTLSAHDALFGGNRTDQASIQFPNGSTRTLPLGSDGVVLTGLPRGRYSLRAEGSSGLAFDKTINLSRSRSVEMMVMSRLDLTLIGVGVLSAGLIVLLAGRPRLRRRLVQKLLWWRHGQGAVVA